MADNRPRPRYTEAAHGRSLPTTLQSVLGAIPEDYPHRARLATELEKLAEKGLYVPPEADVAGLWRAAAVSLNRHLPAPGAPLEPWQRATLLIFNGPGEAA